MEWIKINQTRPNFRKHRHVLVYMPNNYIKTDVQTVFNNGRGGSCFSKGWNKGEGEFEVTHWMPLPKVPR